MLNITEIQNFDEPTLDVYARLNENQLVHYYEPKPGIFIAESPKVIERALDAGYEPVSLLLERRHIEGEAAGILARCGDVPVFTADLEVLTRLTGFSLTRGALCAMRRRALPSVEEICSGARRIAILENVMNPTNLGAIFRSAAALNMDAVLLTPACTNPLYRRASRVSMGTVFQIPWTLIDESFGVWPQVGMTKLREMGFCTVAMALTDQSVSIDDPAIRAQEKLAILLGTEGDGLSKETIRSCDYTVKIPMSHGVDSLNVAAASAVAFWELGKQQRNNNKI
jgi:tRNA G18 (ribose-2'-O)-methylase SpoU